MDADRLAKLANDGPSAGKAADTETGGIEACLRVVLRPVEPSPAFREELRLRLERAARRDRSAVQVVASGERTRGVLVGAAVLSVAGALVYLWRSRLPQSASRGAVLLKNSMVH